MKPAAAVDEIGPDLYRISVHIPDFDLQFNQFLVKDDEPLLFHAGLKQLFPVYKEAVASVLPPESIRWIALSHFEADECGGLNDWLAVAPEAQPACSDVAAMVSVNDYSARPARAMVDGEVIETGKYRFRLCRTPHLPHGWDAAMLFEEKEKTLLCSDLFHQAGNVAPKTTSDVVGRSMEVLKAYQEGPMADYAPYTPNTARLFRKLADLKPQRLAAMHGSTYEGDGEKALMDLDSLFKQLFGK